MNMDLSSHAAGRQSEVRRIEVERVVENGDMVERNSWAYSGTFGGCCQTNLADN